MKQINWMGKQGFYWFLGVVQNIDDPLNIGRVQVRCYGWHTGNLDALPVEALPWAQVVMPPTSASTSSIGRSPTGLLTGSFVFGFFLDGETAQQPMIIGSIHGIPQQVVDGFKDPNGIFPSNIDTPDTPNLAYHNYETDRVYLNRIETRQTDIPIAKKVKAESVAPNQNEEEYELNTWSEPEYRNGKVSNYPRNHVTQTESGHAFEVDDTAECERIHTYHRTGTFQEIIDTGERVTKIVSNDYELVLKDKNVMISGDCNITIQGNAKIKVDGDLVQEVGKNYHLTVYGDKITKIIGNESKEILGFRSEQINQNETKRVSKSKTTIIGDNYSETIGKNKSVTIGTNHSQITSANSLIITSGDSVIISAGKMDIGSGSDFSIGSGANFTMKVTGVTTETYGSTYNVTYSSDYKVYYGNNTYTRKLAGGNDFSCPTDTRSASTDCSTVPTV